MEGSAHATQATRGGAGNVTPPLLASCVGLPCPYCSEPMTAHGKRQPTRDHIKPRSRGHTLPGNTAIVCETCNADKANRSPEGWLMSLLRHGDRRAVTFAAFMLAHRGAVYE